MFKKIRYIAGLIIIASILAVPLQAAGTGSANTGKSTAAENIRWVKTLNDMASANYNCIVYNQGLYCVVGDGGVVLTSSDGVSWTGRSGSTGNDLTKVVFAAGKFIAIGDKGTVVTSADGTAWTQHKTGTDEKLLDIAWNGSIFAAVGTNGVIATSRDFTKWSVHKSGKKADLHKVVWGRNTFAAVGSSGSIITSVDGINWTFRETGIKSHIYDVLYDGEKFIAVGGGYGPWEEDLGRCYGGVVIISEDGVKWRAVVKGTLMLNTFNNVAYNGDVYYASDSIFDVMYMSYDGRRWTRIKNRFSLDYLISYGKNFIAYDNHGINVSKDGISWERVPTGVNIYVPGTNVSTIKSIAKGPDKYVAVGDCSTITMSTDLKSWSVVKAPKHPIRYCEIAYGNGVYVAIGYNGGMAVSKDGTSWSVIPHPSDYWFKHITWGNNRFVVVGIDGIILTSTDGYTWNQKYDRRFHFDGLAFGNGKFVAQGRREGYFENDRYIPEEAVSLISTDGENWDMKPATVENIIIVRAVRWINNKFFAVGSASISSSVEEGGLLMSSPDGVKWTRVKSGIIGEIKDIDWNGKTYAAVADEVDDFHNKKVFYETTSSPDGIKWTARKSDKDLGLNSVAWDGSRFVAVGEAGETFVSKDGADWSQCRSGTNVDLERVAYINGKLIALGFDGFIGLGEVK